MMTDEQGLSLLNEWLGMAREKHPDYADGKEEACDVITEEFFEFVRAIETESAERQREEALDVAVTALRFILGEHERDAR